MISKKRKMKRTLWLFAGLATNLSLASFVISSCGNQRQETYDPLNYDQKFGFDKSTYDKLESDLMDMVKTELEKRDKERSEGDSDKAWDKKIAELGGSNKVINELQNSLNAFQENFFGVNGEYRAHSFNTKTESLINFAKQNFDINIARDVNLQTLREECNDIKQTYYDYLSNALEIAYKDDPEKATKINEKLNEFNQTFEQYYEDAKKKSVDKVQILSELRLNFIGYFSSISDEMSKLNSQNRLKDFLNDYKFEVNEETATKKNLLWENLEDSDEYNPKDGYKDMSSILSKDVFTINATKDNNLFSTQDTTKSWSDVKTISGYILTPYIANLNSDPYNNVYDVDVDWQLVDAKLYNERLAKYNGDESNPNFQKEIDAITAHSFYGKDELRENGVDVDSEDASNLSNGLSKYSWPISDKFQMKQLFNTFVKDKPWNFAWTDDNHKKYGMDTFISGDASSSEYSYVADAEQLGSFGLQINEQPVTEILEEMANDEKQQENTQNLLSSDQNENVKNCLKTCSLCARVLVKELDKDVNADLRIGYKQNNKRNIGWNPLNQEWDFSEDKSMPVDEDIVNGNSEESYNHFKELYEKALETLDFDALNKAIDASLGSMIVLSTLAVILNVIIAMTLVVCVIAYCRHQNFPNPENIKAKYQIAIALLGIGLALLFVSTIFFTIYFDINLSNYKENLKKFLMSDENNEYDFTKTMNEYSKIKTKSDWDKQTNPLNILKYLNNFEDTNSDFKVYKKARDEDHAWGLKDFFAQFAPMMIWAAVNLLLTILGVIALTKLVTKMLQDGGAVDDNTDVWKEFKNFMDDRTASKLAAADEAQRSSWLAEPINDTEDLIIQ